MKVAVISMNSAAKEYEEENDNLDIESIAAKYGRTNDSVELRDDNGHLVAYAAWKQGYNHYSFCKNPKADYPCDLDALR